MKRRSKYGVIVAKLHYGSSECSVVLCGKRRSQKNWTSDQRLVDCRNCRRMLRGRT